MAAKVDDLQVELAAVDLPENTGDPAAPKSNVDGDPAVPKSNVDGDSSPEETMSIHTIVPEKLKKIYQISITKVKLITLVVKVLLFTSVLACLVYSKLTIIQILKELHLLSNFSSPINEFIPDGSSSPEEAATTLYWMLLFIVLIPNIITWLRSLSGVLSRSPQRPWPGKKAFIVCVVMSFFEALIESFLIFYILITLPPVVSTLVMCGVCRIESIFDYITDIREIRGVFSGGIKENRYFPVASDCLNTQPARDRQLTSEEYKWNMVKFIVISVCLGFLIICQLGGITIVAIFLSFAYTDNITNKVFIAMNSFSMPCVILLSITWYGWIQKEFYQPSEKSVEKAKKVHREKSVTAKWKASFIAASIRLVTYPFASYIIFKYLYNLQFGDEVNPWDHDTLANAFQWSHNHIHVFVVHITTSFLGYILSWIACYMTLHIYGLVLPVMLATPLSLLVYLFSTISSNANGSIFILYPFQKPDSDHITGWKNFILSDWYLSVLGIASFLWIAQFLATLKLFITKNAILASDENMFNRPYYNSVLLEQSLIINRAVSHNTNQVKKDGRRQPSMVYICSTMFRENFEEMKQMLTSLKRVADLYEKESKEKPNDCDKYESHIFFDGGCREDDLSPYAIQLMSLIEDTLNVTLNAEENAKNATENATMNATEGSIENATEGSTENATEGSTENATEGSTENATEGLTKNATEDSTKNATEDSTKNATEDSTKNATQDSTENATEDSTENATEGSTENATEGSTENATEGSTENATEGSTENATEGSTKNATEDSTKNATEDLTKNAKKDSEKNATEDSTKNAKMKASIRKTPYGYQFFWLINNLMPFVIHLKDNHKIRNKKRWSQVMYMNYILNYRSNDDLSNTFILTTDADIDFKAESASVLLDMLARDATAGAVCSHTHPLGNGPLYWYQLFDYAIGHWLQKSTEHILGSVLCCPGCFSMFRCSALKECLTTYSSEVTDAMEFLTKDMGEDRWLCTLLVERGWRLEYCAISNNLTYCPVEFDEFFKQRRRWIPSTVANLWLLITKASKITSKNKYISWPFIAYQIIVLVSTIISPATVILVIASGLNSSFGFNSTVIIVILSIIAVCYGIICIYASQKTQLDIAKILTFIFSIIMVVVIVGIVMETINNIVTSIKPNITNSIKDEMIYKNNILPVSESTLYIGLFAVIFLITALLHFSEGLALLHSLWYLLGLPSGYLLLLIYSTANLNDRSWGTRETKNKSEKSLLQIVQQKLKELIIKVIKKTFKQETVITESSQEPTPEEVFIIEEPDSESQESATAQNAPRLSKWLNDIKSIQFYKNFFKEGYTEEWLIADMNENDLKELEITPAGYRYHLLKAIKELPQTPIKTGLPKSVKAWIEDLKLNDKYVNDKYEDKFRDAGYHEEDVENIIYITKEELMEEIGVKKKAHVNRFLKGIQRMKIRTEDEEKVATTENLLQQIKSNSSENKSLANEALEKEEEKFWFKLVDPGQSKSILKPIPEGLTQANKLRNDLNFLRNYALLAMFLINFIWLILLSVFTFIELNAFGLSSSVLGLLFLAVYGILISFQFIGMLLHRAVTLCQLIARLDQALPTETTQEDTAISSSA